MIKNIIGGNVIICRMGVTNSSSRMSVRKIGGLTVPFMVVVKIRGLGASAIHRGTRGQIGPFSNGGMQCCFPLTFRG